MGKRKPTTGMRAATISGLLALLLVLQGLAPALAEVPHERQWTQLRDTLDSGATHANYWTEGWAALFSVNLAANVITAGISDDEEVRFDGRVNAVKSALALVDLMISPLPHAPARDRIEELYQAGLEGDEEALRRAETLFRAVAREEQARRAWTARLGSFAVNLAAGLTIAYGDDRPSDGAINFATGMLVNEIKIRTQPRAVSRTWDGYQPVTLNWGDTPLRFEYAWTVTPYHAGLHVRY